ncbi:MAG TPA: hypothetical protein VKB41_16270 [Steroidobacteraceae bacterium]|nr:hypothetical protein [Steroidobacteraceae bacterium]
MQSGTSDTSADFLGALTDAGQWLSRAFFAPGDHALSILGTHAPQVLQALGVSASDRGSVASGIISGIAWFVALILIILACKLIRDLDRVLTAACGRLYQAFLRAGRNVLRRLSIAFRFFELRRQARQAGAQAPEHITLTALEFAVLQAHARLTPGHLLTVSGIVSALKVRSATHVEKALSRLAGLSLIHRTFGAGDGEDGFRLTGPGELFLAAYRAQLQRGNATSLGPAQRKSAPLTTTVSPARLASSSK